MLSSGQPGLYAGIPPAKGLRQIDPSCQPMLFAEVVIDTTTRELGERLFTYKVPDHLHDEVFVGSQVLIPFGNQDATGGCVVALHDDLAATQMAATLNGAETPRLRSILEVLDGESLFDADYVSLLHWVAEYYAASIAEVIAAAIPAAISPKLKRVARLAPPDAQPQPAYGQTTMNFGEQSPPLQLLAAPVTADLSEKIIIKQLELAKGKSVALRTLKQRSGLPQSKFYTSLNKLRRAGAVIVEQENESKAGPRTIQAVIATGQPATTKKQEDILSHLSRAGGQMSVMDLTKAAATTAPTIKKMCAAGILQLINQEILRDPLSTLAGIKRDPPPNLTPHQQQAFDTLNCELARSIEEHKPPEGPWLLQGVTGSGKTEIYLRLIEETLKRGKSALMLVPEISLTPQLAQRLVGRFGDLVAVWHSALSAGERYDTWRRLRAGQARVLLGARSAILSSLPDIGLIILDEEHDGSYKQSSPNPRYNARTVAVERARRENALLLLGSATPDVGTYLECKDAGRIVELPERVFKQALPSSRLIDMRQESMVGNRGIFSNALQQAMAERLERKEQIILLINRRGYASHVFCKACGFVVRCHNCSVSLVFHQNAADPSGHLICHHCAFVSHSWQICPSCESPFIRHFGLGTQKVEEEVQEMFPSARTLRLDSDITTRKGAYEEIFRAFSAGEADILIGTQIVAKGLDIARVTLVGVLTADAAFNLPDYRSVERGFQLLTQVSGRAGRGEHPGEVILQTYNVDLPALALARRQDYQTFVDQELSSRKDYEYPPFSQLIRVVLASEDLPMLEATAEQLAENLSTQLEPDFSEDEVKILGPAPCLIERLRNKFRYHLIIKNLAGDRGRVAITRFLRCHRSTAEVQIAVDVDAVDLV